MEMGCETSRATSWGHRPGSVAKLAPYSISPYRGSPRNIFVKLCVEVLKPVFYVNVFAFINGTWISYTACIALQY